MNGKIYKRKLLNPSRFKGLSALAASWGIYFYLPYLAVYAGTNLPIFAACAAGIYGVSQFSENRVINSIEAIEFGDQKGKLLINIATSPVVSTNIVCSPEDIRSMVSLPNDG